MSPRWPLLVLPLMLLTVSIAAPEGALARGGDRNEVRVAGSCGKGASSKLKLKDDDGGIEAEFEVDTNRVGTSWRVALTSEGRVVWRGSRRTTARSGSFSVERRLGNLPGADQVTARAVGPRGLTCQATATLRG